MERGSKCLKTFIALLLIVFPVVFLIANAEVLLEQSNSDGYLAAFNHTYGKLLSSRMRRLQNLFMEKKQTPITNVPIAPPPPARSPAEEYELQWEFLADEKLWPYVGYKDWMNKFEIGSRKYFNSLATFPRARPQRLHGDLGYFPNNGSAMFSYGPEPPELDSNETLKKEALEAGGGFYLNLSNHLPLDRDPPDYRSKICKVDYDYKQLSDATVVITFYNEPMSTLLRSVHAVLNRTPPCILREIILVDDHSNTTDALPGGFLYEYIKLLPKTKILRLPERRGLVMARLAGAQIARAPVLVVLDSHIEVNDGWLEPQLQRLYESPESVVFPQIAGIRSENFEHAQWDGIGCYISFKWIMQERSMAVIKPESRAPIPSPSMAGGLFAVNLEWFWEMGGYDEEFSMWGAENVEMGFRSWLCGGRLECTPCAITYHIYRKGWTNFRFNLARGVGYRSPSAAVVKNRLRTSRAWTGEMFAISDTFISRPNFDMGSMDEMINLQKKLHCRKFDYFLDKVDKMQPIRTLDSIDISGEIRNEKHSNHCLDSLGHHNSGDKFGSYWCHGMGGTQAFLRMNDTKQLHPSADESKCMNGAKFEFERCPEAKSSSNTGWDLTEHGQLMYIPTMQCLAMSAPDGKSPTLVMKPCNRDDSEQRWKFQKFQKPSFEPIHYSKDFLDRSARIKKLKEEGLYT